MNICPVCFSLLKHKDQENYCPNASLHMIIKDILILNCSQLTVKAKEETLKKLKSAVSSKISEQQCILIVFLAQLEIYLNQQWISCHTINFTTPLLSELLKNSDATYYSSAVKMVQYVINWDTIISELNSKKKLKKSFIEYYSDFISTEGWNRITLFFAEEKKLSFSFIGKYKDKLDWFIVAPYLYKNELMTNDIVKKYYSYLEGYLTKKHLLNKFYNNGNETTETINTKTSLNNNEGEKENKTNNIEKNINMITDRTKTISEKNITSTEMIQNNIDSNKAKRDIAIENYLNIISKNFSFKS